MPDLSSSGTRNWIASKAPALAAALGEQLARESWTMDDDNQVLARLVEAGRFLEHPLNLAALAKQPFLDDLRQILMYLSAPRRLQLIEHLDRAGNLHEVDFGVLLLDPSAAPPQGSSAQDAVRVLCNSVENLQARQLLREVFAPERLQLIADAISAAATINAPGQEPT